MTPRGLFGLGLASLALGASLQSGIGHDRVVEHVAWGLAGASGFAGLMTLTPAGLRRLARPGFLAAVSIGLAAAVEQAITGTTAWTAVAQPTALLAVACPIGIASEACRPSPIRKAHHWLAVMGAAFLPPLLLASLGATAMSLVSVFTGVTLLWLAGLPRGLTMLGSLLGALTIPLALAANRDALVLALAANPGPAVVASGGLTGAGPGAAAAGRLGLMTGHADTMLLAHVGEELGAFGALLVLGTAFLIPAVAFFIAAAARDRFSALLASGVGVLLAAQATVHALGALGMAPPNLVPLPMFSLGAASTLPTWLAIGCVACIARGPRPEMAAGTVEYGPNEAIPNWESILAR